MAVVRWKEDGRDGETVFGFEQDWRAFASQQEWGDHIGVDTICRKALAFDELLFLLLEDGSVRAYMKRFGKERTATLDSKNARSLELHHQHMRKSPD